jgi:hypothetical protein
VREVRLPTALPGNKACPLGNPIWEEGGGKSWTMAGSPRALRPNSRFVLRKALALSLLGVHSFLRNSRRKEPLFYPTRGRVLPQVCPLPLEVQA